MLICNVVGARPNFMKMGPIVHELERRGLDQMLVHTGQHYDANMSQAFFDELGLPEPDVYLGVGSDTHARQTARIMTAFEAVCLEHAPDLVLVGGDVNSTLAAALVAAKLHVPVGHVEAGLRSFDRTMPEEVNRVVTDHLADLLFVTEPSGAENLRREGVTAEKVHLVGNCMVDTLLRHVDRAVAGAPWTDFGLTPGRYGLLTLHRPANVDDPAMLERLLQVVNGIAEDVPVVFPVHPRTQARLDELGLRFGRTLHRSGPLPYLTFLGLMARARFVLTDSGGIQEETTALGVPCLTLRENTERPVTLAEGTNRLVGTDPKRLRGAVARLLEGDAPAGQRPALWDGHAAARIVDVLERWHAAPFVNLT